MCMRRLVRFQIAMGRACSFWAKFILLRSPLKRGAADSDMVDVYQVVATGRLGSLQHRFETTAPEETRGHKTVGEAAAERDSAVPMRRDREALDTTLGEEASNGCGGQYGQERSW